MSGSKNIAPIQRHFCVLKFRPLAAPASCVRIVGAAVYRLYDYLGTDVDPRTDRKTYALARRMQPDETQVTMVSGALVP